MVVRALPTMRGSCAVAAIVLFATCAMCEAQSGPVGPVQRAVYPNPKSMTTGSDYVGLSSEFATTCSATTADDGSCGTVLTNALSRLQSSVFIGGAASDGSMCNGAASSAVLQGLDVTVDSQPALATGVDESYSLDIQAPRAKLSANTTWGALAGMQSFIQLVQWTVSTTVGPDGQTKPAAASNDYCISGAPIAIQDEPRFAWRGLLMDTSRHFLHPATIRRTLDAMAMNKMNHLHWHITDDNSWPLVSEKYPKFSQLGAYAPDLVYNKDDIAAIVSYANDRGIVIVPELDMPAHAAVWGAAYPDLVVSCSGGQTLLDPTGSVYPVLADLIAEFSTLFGSAYVHLGGDEVDTLQCWNESASVQAFMASHGIANVTELRNYFQQQVQDVVVKAQKSTIFWEEVFDKGFDLQESTVVNVWLSSAETVSVVKAGYRAIHSYGWYLDQQTPPGGTHYFGQDTWMNFYMNDPIGNASLTAAEAARVLGGEGSMWGEQVDDTDAEVRMWPRACGIAAALWEQADSRDVTAATPRIYAQRCYMVQQGVAAGPLRPASVTGVCTLPGNSRFRQ